MFFREFRVTTTLLIILAIVTGLYGLGWLNEEIKNWRQSKKPQPIQTISGSNPAHPQQPQPIQFNNQAHNPEVVNRAIMLISCVTMLIASFIIMKIFPEMSNEKLYKLRPLIVPTFVEALIIGCLYVTNRSLRVFVWEMYFQ